VPAPVGGRPAAGPPSRPGGAAAVFPVLSSAV